MPLNEESRWKKALLALPILVKVAQNPDTALYGKYPGRITYGQLGKLIGVSPANIGSVCAYIRDIMARPLDLPHINCLVVNAQTGYPTEIEAGDTADDAQRKFKEFSSRVYECERWDELLDWGKPFDTLNLVYVPSVEELESELKKSPDDNELKEKLAIALADGSLSETEMKRLGEVIRDLPQDKALYPRAVLAQYDGKQKESIEWLVKYATAFSQKKDAPFYSDELYYWIVLPFALSKESSLRLADALRENWPESAAVFTLQGLAKTFDEKAPEDAIDDFVLALSKDEEYWLAAWLCAQVYDDQKNWRAARNYFYKALKSQTAQQLSDIHFELAWSLGKLKAYPDEEKHYRLCLELDPDFPYARNNLGLSLHKQGRYKEALVVFEEALERGNDKKYPLWNKARTLKKLGRFQQAIEIWKQDIYRGKLTKFAQQEIARLEALRGRRSRTAF